VCRRRRRHQDPPASLPFITSVRRVRVGREGSPGACITVVLAGSRSPWIHRRYIDLTIRRPHRPSSIRVDAGCPRDLSSGYRFSSSVHTDETPLAVIAFCWLEPVFSFFLLSRSRSREHGVKDSPVICVCSLRRSNPPIQRSPSTPSSWPLFLLVFIKFDLRRCCDVCHHQPRSSRPCCACPLPCCVLPPRAWTSARGHA
jgi:hypothetical protein